MKKILLCILCSISILGSFVLGFYYCKQRVIHGEEGIIQKDIDRIAIVNLDEGIQVDNERMLYSSKLLNFASDYVYVGLSEARTGMEIDEYAAYIIIPSNFSKCIESINGEPQQVEIVYMINSRLTDQNRLEVEKRLSTFKDLLNSNAAYVYLSSVLNEFHSVQDSSITIMEHDKADLDNIQNINPEDIFNMIDFSEMKDTENNIENVDLTQYTDKNTTELESIFSELNGGLAEGQKRYQEIAKGYSTISEEVNNVTDAVSGYDPLMDSNGNEVYEEGLEHLKQAIDEYNENVDTQGETAEQKLKEAIAYVSQEYAKAVLERVQNNVDTKLEEIQGINKQIVQEKITIWKSEQATYYSTLNQQVNNTIKTYIDNYSDQQKDIHDDISNAIEDLLISINNLSDNNITKNQVEKCINKYIENVDKLFAKYKGNNVIQEINFNDYGEIIPNFQDDSIVLPDVKKLCKEDEKEEEPPEDTTTQEDESKPEKVFIDVDEEIEIEDEITDYVSEKEGDIKDIITMITSDVFVSKSDITNIIDNEIIKSITDENQNEIANYNTVTKNLLTSIQNYDSSMTEYNLYDYVKTNEITKHQTALSKNITALGNAMNEKNTEYLEFINKLYQNTNENISNLQGDMQKANDASKTELNKVITELKGNREDIQKENDEILGSFADKLSYTRMGTLEYAEMQKFMASPVNASQQVDGEKIEEGNTIEEMQLDYRWILFAAGMLILFILVINLILKIVRGRKELKALENE